MTMHIHLHVVYCHFHNMTAETGSCDKDHMSHKDKKKMAICLFTGKCWLNLTLLNADSS